MSQHDAWVAQLLSMGFPLARILHVLPDHNNLDSAINCLLETAHTPLPPRFFGVISLDDDDDVEQIPQVAVSSPQDAANRPQAAAPKAPAQIVADLPNLPVQPCAACASAQVSVPSAPAQVPVVAQPAQASAPSAPAPESIPVQVAQAPVALPQPVASAPAALPGKVFHADPAQAPVLTTNSAQAPPIPQLGATVDASASSSAAPARRTCPRTDALIGIRHESGVPASSLLPPVRSLFTSLTGIFGSWEASSSSSSAPPDNKRQRSPLEMYYTAEEIAVSGDDILRAPKKPKPTDYTGTIHDVRQPAAQSSSSGVDPSLRLPPIDPRINTLSWPNWASERGSLDRNSLANNANSLAPAQDIVRLGSLTTMNREWSASGEGYRSPWTSFSQSRDIKALFDEDDMVKRLSVYNTWQYHMGSGRNTCHYGTDMHLANEENIQFRWIEPQTMTMVMNVKSAILFTIKDFRFIPEEVNCFYRAVRVPKDERFFPHDSISDPMAETVMKFNPPNNHRDHESAQPPPFCRYPLRPEQLRSLGWMRSREQNTAPFKLSYDKLFHGWPGEDRLFDRGYLFSDADDLTDHGAAPWFIRASYNLVRGDYASGKYVLLRKSGRSLHNGSTWKSEFGVDLKIEAEFASRGGILADQLGYGKTATALGLIAFDTPESTKAALQDFMSFEDRQSYFVCPSTLVLVPPNLLGQWVEQIAKFYLPPGTTKEKEIEWRSKAKSGGACRGFLGCPKSVVCFESVSKLKQMLPEELLSFDIVLCTLRIFTSQVYDKRRDEIAHSADGPVGYDEGGPNHWDTWANRERKSLSLHRTLKRATRMRYKTMYKERFPVLEQFFWRRIIYDESHEIEAMGSKVKRAITQMRTQFCWGLTGSPVLDTLCGIDTAAMILRIDLVGWDSKHLGWTKNAKFRQRAEAFVQEFVRKNTETSYAPIPMEEHVIHVTLQPEERALYLAQHNVKGDKAQLVQLCSHFSGGESHNLDATTEIERVLDNKRASVSDRTDSVKALLALCCYLHNCSGAVANAPNSWITITNATIAQIPSTEAKANITAFRDAAIREFRADRVPETARFVTPPEPGVFHFLHGDRSNMYDWQQVGRLSRSNKGALLSHFIRRIAIALEGYRKSLSALTFFETTVSVLRNNASERVCPVCLDEGLELGRIAISSCGHVYCIDCMDTIQNEKTCAVCRYTPLRKEDFSIIKPREAPNAVGGDKSKFEEFGSKIYVVYQKLQEIRREDPTAKVIMFTQFTWLRFKYENVLRKFGIPFITLKGTTAQRGNAIDAFQNDLNSNAWVLLMDLNNSASGTHITSANHVIFIHPMVCDSPQTAAAYEKQAIGRCQRYGQTKVVKVWRFVASNTIEEEITALHQATIAQNPAADMELPNIENVA